MSVTATPPTADEPDLAELEGLKAAHDQIREQVSHQIIGQDDVVDQLLIAVFARGHCILEGVPGLAKTLMISTRWPGPCRSTSAASNSPPT